MDHIDRLLARQGLSKSRLADVRENRMMQVPGVGEGVALRGHLKILGISEDKVWTLADDHNMITNTGYLLMASMWGRPTSPETYTTLQPKRIGIGSGSGTQTPSMTTLFMGAVPTYIGAVDEAVVFTGSPSTNGCRYEMLVPNGTGADPYNTTPLVEAGLFPNTYSGGATGAGGMIAHKTYPVINKNDQFSLLYLWSFAFTAI